MPHLLSTLLLVVKICVLSFLVRRWWCWEQKSLSEFGRNLQLKTGFPLAKSSPDRHPGAGSVHVRVQVKPSVPARVQLQKLPSSVQRDFEKRPSAANFDVRLCVCVCGVRQRGCFGGVSVFGARPVFFCFDFFDVRILSRLRKSRRRFERVACCCCCLNIVQINKGVICPQWLWFGVWLNRPSNDWLLLVVDRCIRVQVSKISFKAIWK